MLTNISSVADTSAADLHAHVYKSIQVRGVVPRRRRGWSSVHETETHLWPDAKQQELWNFIKKTALGHKLSHSASIQHNQIGNGFQAFLQADATLAQLDSVDAFATNIHEWDGFVWIDVKMHLDTSAAARQGKAETAKQMVDLFDRWRARPQSFDSDVRDEWVGYANLIINEYKRCYLQPNLSEPLAFLESGNAHIFNSLMIEQDSKDAFNIRCERVRNFLTSDGFARIPHIDASCRLMATLRRAVRRGELVSKEKAEHAMYGFGQDMEMISVFAPYVDAVFMDRTMHRWITEPDCNLPQRYNFRAFSASNWTAFDQFLDEVEQRAPPNHDVWLRAVYGWQA